MTDALLAKLLNDINQYNRIIAQRYIASKNAK